MLDFKHYRRDYFLLCEAVEGTTCRDYSSGIHARNSALRITTPLCINTECSSVKIWIPLKILGVLKKKITKIDAFKP